MSRCPWQFRGGCRMQGGEGARDNPDPGGLVGAYVRGSRVTSRRVKQLKTRGDWTRLGQGRTGGGGAGGRHAMAAMCSLPCTTQASDPAGTGRNGSGVSSGVVDRSCRPAAPATPFSAAASRRAFSTGAALGRPQYHPPSLQPSACPEHTGAGWGWRGQPGPGHREPTRSSDSGGRAHLGREGGKGPES